MGAILAPFHSAIQRFFPGETFFRRRAFDPALPIGYFSPFTRTVRPVRAACRTSSMSKSAKTEQPASFELALAELEKIVASMESGKLTLEQSLAAHKRGLELAQYCQSVLTRAQQQVKVLEENTLKNLPGADDDR